MRTVVKMNTKSKLTVGLVLDESLDPPDGVQQYVLRVGDWLTAQGHNVHYLVGETTRTDKQHIHSLSRNVKVSYNGNRLSVPLPTSGTKLRRLLEQLQLDVLHVQTPYSPLLAGKLVRRASAATVVVGTFHILPYDRLAVVGSQLLARINHRTARRFDAMMAVSKPAAEFAQRVFGFNSTIVSNPFDYQAFCIPTPSKKQTDSVSIVFLGRLVERKGAFQLLRAVKSIIETQTTTTKFHVTIAGKGTDYDKMQQYIIEHNLGATVSMPGFITEEDKAVFLAGADIAVFPSISGESFGISLLEAMAAARGVVLAGNNPGYTSVMEAHEQLIDPLDTNEFGKTLTRWMDDTASRQRAARRQKQYVQQFDIGVIGPQVLAIYNKALQTRRTS